MPTIKRNVSSSYNLFSFVKENRNILGLGLVIFFALCLYMYFNRALFSFAGNRTLYGDDLDVHAIMTNPNTSIFEKLTDTSSNKNRYVTNTMLVVFWKIVGHCYKTRINGILFFANVVLVFVMFTAVFFCLNIKNLIWRSAIAGGAALFFASSRFAYYSYEEIFGLMENVANGLTIIFIACLWKDNFKFSKLFWAANALYPIIIYTHERFAVLAGVLTAYCILAALLNSSEDKLKSLLHALPAIVMFLLFMIQRIFLFKNRFLDGTNGIDAITTFKLSTFFFMASKIFFYMLGINAMDDIPYNGIPPEAVPKAVYCLNALILIFVLYIAFKFFKSEKNNKPLLFKIVFCNLGFLFLCGIAAATIRVEMRWLYAPLGILIFTTINMFSFVFEKSQNDKRSGLLLTGVFVLLMCVAVENFYCRHWNCINNWGIRTDAFELSDELNKHSNINTLYIITNKAPLYGEKHILDVAKIEGKSIENVTFIKGLRELGMLNSKDVVLLHIDGKDDYVDLTELLQDRTF